jgi:trimethylamine---corrinoid protein Co-methyltransferase
MCVNRIRHSDMVLDTARFARLSEEDCRKIHAASLELLDRVGVRLHLQEAVDLLKRAGAQITDGNLVRVPHTLVERALATAPRCVVLHDREGNPVMPLEGYRCYYGPGSDTLNIIDHRTGERRKPVLKDVQEGATLCDALPHIDFVMSMVLPMDVDPAIADVYQMEAMLSHTTKPILTVSYELQGLVGAVEMAEAVAGGQEALQRTPFVACYINAVSGLVHNKEALQKLLYLSDKGLPALYIPSSTAGITSPVTPAGAVALDNAGVLVGLVISQLTREGAPYVMPGMQPSPMDMRTLVAAYVDPEHGILQGLAHLYGLPAFGLGGVSDAKVVDQQAAAEAALTLLAEALVGGNIVHDLGYLESGLTFSFAQLAICDELVGWVEAFFRRVEVSAETLAVDVIARVGPEGDYLKTDHTRRHYRRAWSPQLFERDNYDAWAKKGRKTCGERAADKVTEILATHRPQPLPDPVRRRLREIVDKVEAKQK